MPASTLPQRPLPHPLELVLRAALAYTLLITLATHYDKSLIDLLLPAFRSIILALDDHYRIVSFGTGTEGADTVLRLRVTLARPLFVGTHLVMPDPRGWADASTAIGHIVLPALIALGAVIAWPSSGLREWLIRLCIALLLLLPLLLFDTPCILLASIWGLLVEAHDPGRFSPLLIFESFLQSGGRAALGITCAVLAIALGNAVTTRRLR